MRTEPNAVRWAKIEPLWEDESIIQLHEKKAMFDPRGEACFTGIMEEGTVVVNVFSNGRIAATDVLLIRWANGSTEGFGRQVYSLNRMGAQMAWTIQAR